MKNAQGQPESKPHFVARKRVKVIDVLTAGFTPKVLYIFKVGIVCSATVKRLSGVSVGRKAINIPIMIHLSLLDHPLDDLLKVHM